MHYRRWIVHTTPRVIHGQVAEMRREVETDVTVSAAFLLVILMWVLILLYGLWSCFSSSAGWWLSAVQVAWRLWWQGARLSLWLWEWFSGFMGGEWQNQHWTGPLGFTPPEEWPANISYGETGSAWQHWRWGAAWTPWG